MEKKNWGVMGVCRGMMAGLAREAWVKDANGSKFRGTEADAKDFAKKLNDDLTGISRLNISYYAEKFPQRKYA